MKPTAPCKTVRIAPDEQAFEIAPGQTLLTAIEQAGRTWPSSCRSGSCRTCLSTLLQGQVHYEMTWPGLSPEEKAEGAVLPCVAYADSDVRLKNPFDD
jgi:ferredoxin